MVVMLTSFKRWNSGAAIYLTSQAGKVGEKILRYSRMEGVSGRRARSLQVARLRVFSLVREKRRCLMGGEVVAGLLDSAGLGAFSVRAGVVSSAGTFEMTGSQTVGLTFGG